MAETEIMNKKYQAIVTMPFPVPGITDQWAPYIIASINPNDLYIGNIHDLFYEDRNSITVKRLQALTPGTYYIEFKTLPLTHTDGIFRAEILTISRCGDVPLAEHGERLVSAYNEFVDVNKRDSEFMFHDGKQSVLFEIPMEFMSRAMCPCTINLKKLFFVDAIEYTVLEADSHGNMDGYRFRLGFGLNTDMYLFYRNLDILKDFRHKLLFEWEHVVR